MDYLVLIMQCFLLSTAGFVFCVSKAGFHKRFLYKDNIVLAIIASILSIIVYNILSDYFWYFFFIINPILTAGLFFLLLLYRFYRNPRRKITAKPGEFLSPADGRVIYIKELEKDQIPVSVKKARMSTLSEITKTDILSEPCYLIGIAMTLFDVHINRAPIAGKVILVKHSPGTYLGLNKPESTFSNERNTLVIEGDDGIKVGVVQIAAKYVKRCIISAREGDYMQHGQVIGKIRVGSQADLIIPRISDILVREGDQVFAGLTVIGRLEKDAI